MAEPIRVYALADEIGVDAPTLVAWLSANRVFDKSASSWLDGSTAEWVRSEDLAGRLRHSLTVLELSRRLQISEPLAMALAREHKPSLIASSECLSSEAGSLIRDRVLDAGPQSSLAFAMAPPTLDALAQVLGVTRQELQRRYFDAAGLAAPLTRGAVFALVDEALGSTEKEASGPPITRVLLARTLMITQEQVDALADAAGVVLERGRIPRRSLKAVLAGWLRMVRRSGLALQRHDGTKQPAEAAETSTRDIDRGERPGNTACDVPAPRLVAPVLPRMALRPGDPASVGDYELLGRLGQGGMGTVYRARRHGTASDVALKVIADRLHGNAEALERFRREAALLKEVGGAFTAKVIDVRTAPPGPYMVMELLNGNSLEHTVDTAGALPSQVVSAVALGLVDALVDLHDRQIVHRDFKPANVMLTTAGPKVIDFGIAHLLEAPGLTEDGFQPGTLPYMAPEQFLGKVVSGRTDIFAWAGTVLFALTGNDPFAGDSSGAVMRSVLEDEPEDLHHVDDGLLQALLIECFTKEDDRRPSARDVRAVLLQGRPPSVALAEVAAIVGSMFTSRLD